MEAISQKWLDLFKLLPGYDPVATAEDCWFDEAVADKACEFFYTFLTFIEGHNAGQPFALEPWQKAVIGCLFGWKRPNGLRRYRKFLLYIPRKNGKTPLVAGILLLIALCDGEPGAQIYAAAASTDQASLLFKHMSLMASQSPELSEITTTYKSFKSMNFPQNTTVKVLSAKANTAHGKNTHCFAVDELHAQNDRELLDALTTSTGTRTQPLEIYLTTADYDRPSICNEVYEYACRVRDGVFPDKTFLPVIYEALIGDDWKDPAVWRKANPNLGVSIREDWLAEEAETASRKPDYLNAFKRLHLNIRTGASVAWIPMHEWDACDAELPDLTGRECYAGLDLSSTQDVTAFVMVFPPVYENEPTWIVPKMWIPEDTAHERQRVGGIPYATWIEQGFMLSTPGNAVDYEFVKAEILACASKYQINLIAFDPWNADMFAQHLAAEGLRVGEWRQGFGSMNAPCKELQRMILTREVAHGGHAVLRWMAGNVMVETDAIGNIRPSKKKSSQKIDGMVALVMAVGGMMLGGHAAGRYYETHDLEME